MLFCLSLLLMISDEHVYNKLDFRSVVGLAALISMKRLFAGARLNLDQGKDVGCRVSD